MADQSDIDKLKRQIATLNDAIMGGEKQTVINGESVTYRSVDEMRTARSDAETRLNTMIAEVSGAPRRPSRRTQIVYSGRGYNDNPFWGSDGFHFRR